MIYTHVAAALLGAALAATGAWQVQGWRLGQQIATMRQAAAESEAAAVREARATESRRFTNVQEAQNAAQKRAQSARADAAAARTELDRLRGDLAAGAGRTASESPAACTVRADTSGELLGQCAAAYLELAGKADRHASDARTLIEAWPR